MMVDQLGTNPVPIQLPIGKAATFKGVYDLVEMRSIIWTGEESEVSSRNTQIVFIFDFDDFC